MMNATKSAGPVTFEFPTADAAWTFADRVEEMCVVLGTFYRVVDVDIVDETVLAVATELQGRCC